MYARNEDTTAIIVDYSLQYCATVSIGILIIIELKIMNFPIAASLPIMYKLPYNVYLTAIEHSFHVY